MCRVDERIREEWWGVVDIPHCELCYECTNKPGPVEADGLWIG